MEKNANKLIKEVKINQKLRLKVLLICLIIFDCLLLGALTYLFVKITNVYVGILTLIIFGLCIWFSVFSYKKAKTNTEYKIYKNKMVIKSMSFSGELDLSVVFNVQVKTSFFDFLLRKTKTILISIKTEKATDKIVLPFISEDAEKLCDDIMALAIKCRDKFDKKEQRKTKVDQVALNETEEK